MSEKHCKQNNTKKLADMLTELLERMGDDRQIKIMEICGTHTATAQEAGLQKILPKNITLISGPGCPVCVTPAGYIDQAAQLATEYDAHIFTYGDMVRVPGIKTSLQHARAKGATISAVYSVNDVIKAAQKQKKTEIVFLGVGFETTTPATALAVQVAKREKIENFSVLAGHKRIAPAMEALLNDPEIAIDGFLAPGHVSVIIGADAYQFVPTEYKKPCAIAGFDAEQMLMGLVEITAQLIDGQPKVANVYESRVTAKGNLHALRTIEDVFQIAPANWRGLGTIDDSGLEINDQYAQFDARKRFGLEQPQDNEPDGCRCGDVLKGIIRPNQCPLFDRACRPSSPVGACMVSQEGSCSVYYRFARAKNKDKEK